MTHLVPGSDGPPGYPRNEPGPVARPRLPPVVKWAAGVMFAGAALTLALGIRTGMRWDHPSGDMGPGSGWYGLVLGILLAAAGSVPWLWMACAVLAGRGWARVMSAVFFGLYVLSFVPDLIISFIPARSRTPASAGIVAGVGLELLAGIAAVILLWRPGSSRFFSAAKQARTARR